MVMVIGDDEVTHTMLLENAEGLDDGRNLTDI